MCKEEEKRGSQHCCTHPGFAAQQARQVREGKAGLLVWPPLPNRNHHSPTHSLVDSTSVSPPAGSFSAPAALAPTLAGLAPAAAAAAAAAAPALAGLAAAGLAAAGLPPAGLAFLAAAAGAAAALRLRLA